MIVFLTKGEKMKSLRNLDHLRFFTSVVSKNQKTGDFGTILTRMKIETTNILNLAENQNSLCQT